MSEWPIPPAPTAHIQAAALRAAFPGYVVKRAGTAPGRKGPV